MPLAVLANFVHSLKPSPTQSKGRLTVFPIRGPVPLPPEYVSLAEVLPAKQVEITEISQGGSVPELAVVNHAPNPVLLLDGEELAGAKQNRVLNTTILVAALSKTVVPVSCTEHGRWHYTSVSFASSGNVMSPGIRKKKSQSVSFSLSAEESFKSDQGQVWKEIAALHEKTGTAHLSHTGAMSDAYAGRQKELDELAGGFPMVEGQIGLLVLRDGKVEGCDVISRPDVYRQFHERLVRSYAMEALAEPPAKSGNSAPDPQAAAEAFLEATAAAESASHKSPGLGEDVRLTAPELAGSALVVDGQVVHLATFSVADQEQSTSSPLASLRHRRRYRGA